MVKVLGAAGTIARKLRVWGLKGIAGYLPRHLNAVRFRRRLVRNYRACRGVVPRRGISVIAPISMGYSNSKVVRDFLLALQRAEIPYQAFDTNTRLDAARADYADLVTDPASFQLAKYDHVVEMFRSPLPDGLVPHRARIAFWEGETGVLDAFPYLASPHPVLAMSDFNFECFRRELPPSTPVFKIPYPLQRVPSDFPPASGVRARLGIAPDDFVVFFNFDLGSFHRKNPIGAMKAFSRAFRGDSGARLVFKTNLSKDFGRRVEWLREAARDLGIADSLVLVHGYLPGSEIYSLTDACDVYLSLHRAEGFGIGVAEAMSLGRPVVVTNYSATTEFCKPGNSIPVSFKLVDIRPGEYFTAMKTWADADVDEAAEALRACRADPAYRASIGRAGMAFVERHFSNENFQKAVAAFLDASRQ